MHEKNIINIVCFDLNVLFSKNVFVMHWQIQRRPLNGPTKQTKLQLPMTLWFYWRTNCSNGSCKSLEADDDCNIFWLQVISYFQKHRAVISINVCIEVFDKNGACILLQRCTSSNQFRCIHRCERKMILTFCLWNEEYRKVLKKNYWLKCFTFQSKLHERNIDE